ncbi:MAG: UDP-2,3-diacylglucosamine hydrolase [Campylobacterales bacterium]|nr:UDP-2,3-diacylglucosamine hydrolase [Campylobacterales bacterium]
MHTSLDDTLHEGAILVADSHYAPWRTPFIDFLSALDKGEIQTPQLILMGDNFDLLFGSITQTLLLNRSAIDLLNSLSLKIPIIYLEGNHDFQLSAIFPHIRVIDRTHQPLILNHNGSRVALLHGDIGVPLGYKIYTAFIRNRLILLGLNFLNEKFGGFIINGLSRQMQRKNHCQQIDNFEFIAKRHSRAEWIKGCDMVIEGHYHQNRSFYYSQLIYKNLGAFACNERYYSVKSFQNQSALEEVIFHKEPQ